MPVPQPVTRLNEVLFPYCGPVPLLPGEDPIGYDGLLARVSGAVKPKDIIEEIWIQEIVALTWEAFRLRRARAAYLAARHSVGIARALEPLRARADREELAAGYARQEPEAVAEVDECLAAANVTTDMVTALTMTQAFDLMERIDRMIATTELRRDAVLREIARHRTSFAAAARARLAEHEAAFAVIDAVPPPAAPAKTATPTAAGTPA